MTEKEEERKPVWVRCGKCEHRWIAFYLPMELSQIRRFKNLSCPKCACNPKNVFLSEAPEATS